MDDKKIKSCCGFGHRQVFENISESLDKAICYATEQGCKMFYTGAMGEFDSLFSAAVRKAKASCPDIRLICVKPYMTKDINRNGEYLFTLYDDIIIPTELADIHYKSVINKRNELMIDYCDIIIGYVKRKYGGAYKALVYAKKCQKQTIII